MDAKALLSLMKSRRSIRRFRAEPVAEEDINMILEAAIWAPTGSNEQELRFVVIKDRSLIEQFRRFKSMVNPAALILILVDFASYYSSADSKLRFHPHKRHLPYVDTGLAMMNMLLMAHSLGLATVPLNVSPYLCFIDKPSRGLLARPLRAIAIRLRMSTFGVVFFDRFLRQLGLDPHRYIPAGCLALGYAAESVNVAARQYRGKPIQRQSLDFYVLRRL